jgi:predicted amidohydrolase YtcJ
VVSTYEQMDAEQIAAGFPDGIKSLRWGLQHVDFATPTQLARLKALNCGVSMSGFRWLNGVPRADGLPVGPLYPQILASGIPAGMHEDGVHIAPHNPWFALHYATTGLNVLGQQINPGQQISRQQALHAYTRGNAWYMNRENELGSIEKGQARRPRGARPRLLQRERRRHAQDPPCAHRSSTESGPRHGCGAFRPRP